ncbi:MAG: hypothetical protein VB954_00035 [Thalassolituus sp.]|uniref:hypothetical protein n=1 Tax=Thalassolituus sp. TaxID=2030822 RepID=UPI0039828FF0
MIFEINYKSKFFIVFPLALYALYNALGLNGFQLEHDGYVGVTKMLLESGGEADDFFAIVVRTYAFVESLGVPAALFSFFAYFFILAWLFSKRIVGWWYWVFIVVFTAPLMTYLGQPGKELYLFAFLSIYSFLIISKKYLYGFLSFLFYVAFFRYYYGAVLLTHLLLRFFGGKSIFLVVIVAALSLILIGVNDDILVAIGDIQGRRDYAYNYSLVDVRSAFSNYFEGGDFFAVLGNYFYAFFRLNMPIFFDFDVKEIYLQIYVLCTFYVIYRGVLGRVYWSYLCISMLLVYPLFEPDLGSYLRHYSSLFPIFYLTIYEVSLLEKATSSYRLS